MKKIFNKKAFTLVELLIVIAIIGVLSALLMANFIGVRQRARDAQRKSDLRQIQSALELYRSDTGTYPSTDNFSGCGNAFSNGSTIYMSKIPCDPTSIALGDSSGSYYYKGDSSGYTLVACLENASDGQAVDSNDSSFPSSLSPALCTTTPPKFYILTNP